VSVQFVIGRAGSGKSAYCLEDIRRELLAEPAGDPLVLLVPEQASFQAEHALVTTPGLAGIVRAQVLSFRRLAYRVLQETGGPHRRPIDDIGKKMMIARILDACKEQLRMFGYAAGQQGTIESFLEMINELKRCDLTPDKLALLLGGIFQEGTGIPSADRRLHDKLHDLLIVYRQYDEALNARYFDAEDIPAVVARQAGASDFLRRARIWIDGFHGFTPRELTVLRALMRYAREVRIALCLDRTYEAWEAPNELDLFYPTAMTMVRLLRIAEEEGVQVLEPIVLPPPEESRFLRRPMLSHLEKHLFRPKPAVYSGVIASFTRDLRQGPLAGGRESGDAPHGPAGAAANDAESAAEAADSAAYNADSMGEIKICRAVNRRAEMEGVAREIVRLAREEGCRWREIAVMVRDLETYAEPLANVFESYGIPFFMDHKRTVTHHPLVELVRSALDAVTDGWKYDSVFRFVKTGFLLPPDAERHDRSTTGPAGTDAIAAAAHGSAPGGAANAGPGPETEQAAGNEAGTFPGSALDEVAAAADGTGPAGAPYTGAGWTEADAEPIDQAAMDELENAVLAYGIQGRRWKEPFPTLGSYDAAFGTDIGGFGGNGGAAAATEAGDVGLGGSGTNGAAGAAARYRRLEAARRAVVRALEPLERRLAAAHTVRDHVEALYALLVDVGAARRLERLAERALDEGNPEKAREHTQIWGRVMDVFDQLVEILGDQETDPERFQKLIDAGLDSIRLGLVPPSLDQVLVGSIGRTRSANIRCCFVLGVNDGVFPQAVKEDGWLSEPERERLIASGIELSPGSRRKLLDEQFLIYTALTSPEDRLWLSFPISDEEGKPLLPSEIIRRVRKMFPGLTETFLYPDPPAALGETDHLPYISRPEQAMSLLAVQLRQWLRGLEISPVWWDVYNWAASDPGWRPRWLGMRRALFYANEARPLSRESSLALYGSRIRASVSRMETFASCPFSHFAAYGLRLAERRVYRLEAPDIGQLFHAALGMLLFRLGQEESGLERLTAEERRERAAAIVDELAPGLQGRILLSTRRYAHIARKLKRIVGQAAVMLGEQAQRGRFVPVGLEMAFGDGGELPPLRFRLDNGCEMEIVGRIDRVDAAMTDDGLLVRIIDYKSSRTTLRLPDVFYGLSLQMLTYLDVVLTHAERWLGRPANPAGVLYFHVHQPLLQKKNAVPEHEAERELFRRYQMKGWVTADPEVVRMMDSGLEKGRSDIIPVALKADGEFYKTSSVITEEQWQALREHVRATIRRIGTDITDGKVSVSPYRKGNASACDFCPYRPVCQFDPDVPGGGYVQLQDKPPEQWWTLIGGPSDRKGADTDE